MQLGPYGTRSQTVLAVWRDGSAELRERFLEPESRQWKSVTHKFEVAKQQ